MNLKEFILTENILNELRKIRINLGASYSQFISNSKIIITDPVRLSRNIDGTLDEIKEDLIQLEAGLPILDTEGKCRFLYIPDHDNNYFKGLDVYGLRRVHMTFCSTLSGKKKDGTFDRYRLTSDVSGLFEIVIPTNKKVSSKLFICQNCIKLMIPSYADFATKFGAYNAFDLKSFAQVFSEKTPKEFESASSKLKEIPYTNDWKQISYEYRKKQAWICEDCQEDCAHDRANLDTHHVNGVKSDNRSGNLRALCKSCHKGKHNLL